MVYAALVVVLGLYIVIFLNWRSLWYLGPFTPPSFETAEEAVLQSLSEPETRYNRQYVLILRLPLPKPLRGHQEQIGISLDYQSAYLETADSQLFTLSSTMLNAEQTAELKSLQQKWCETPSNLALNSNNGIFEVGVWCSDIQSSRRIYILASDLPKVFEDLIRRLY